MGNLILKKKSKNGEKPLKIPKFSCFSFHFLKNNSPSCEMSPRKKTLRKLGKGREFFLNYFLGRGVGGEGSGSELL